MIDGKSSEAGSGQGGGGVVLITGASGFIAAATLAFTIILASIGVAARAPTMLIFIVALYMLWRSAAAFLPGMTI